MARPIELHFWPTPNGYKITIMLEECGLPYEVRPVDIMRGAQFAPEFLAISPNNRMPAIVDPTGPAAGRSRCSNRAPSCSISAASRASSIPGRTRASRLSSGCSGRWAGSDPWPASAIISAATRREDPLRHQPLHRRGEPPLRRHEPAPGGPRVPRRRLLDRRHRLLPVGAGWKNQGQDIAEFPFFAAWLDRIAARPAIAFAGWRSAASSGAQQHRRGQGGAEGAVRPEAR